VDHDGLVDRFFARDRICDLQQFEPVGGNSHSHVIHSVELSFDSSNSAFLDNLMPSLSKHEDKTEIQCEGFRTPASCARKLS
jgi:hypothetical protein